MLNDLKLKIYEIRSRKVISVKRFDIVDVVYKVPISYEVAINRPEDCWMAVGEYGVIWQINQLVTRILSMSYRNIKCLRQLLARSENGQIMLSS